MTMATKVIFSAPPLTTNKLTAQQRTQLVRKARKIEQLLGLTPRLIDTSVTLGMLLTNIFFITSSSWRTQDPINITLSPGPSQRRLTKSSPRSFDSTSSGSSSSSSSLARTTSFSSRLYSVGHKRGTTSPGPLDLSEDWPCDTKVPILRLPVESLSTVTPVSFIDTGAVSHPRSTDEDLPTDQSTLTQTIAIDISPRDSATISVSTTPSPNSIRKQKMDRVRRKLGSCVPFDLVFPSITKDSPDSDSSTGSGLNSTQQAKTAAGVARFTDARDSAMSLSDAIAASVALARSQNLSPPKHNVREKRPRSAPAAEFRLKERLSLIMESPEEHQLSFSDNHDLGGYEDSESNLTDAVTNQNFHSTRLSKRPATAPASISTSKTWEFSGDSPPVEKSVKKKPPSYRKPPPPLPADLDC